MAHEGRKFSTKLNLNAKRSGSIFLSGNTMNIFHHFAHFDYIKEVNGKVLIGYLMWKV